MDKKSGKSGTEAEMPTVHEKRYSSTRSSAIRMARLRDRRKRGFVCYMIEVSDADIERLVRRGYLDRLRRDDPASVEVAVGAVLDRL